MNRIFAAVAALFICAAAHGQSPGNNTNHAFLVGKGAGKTGYTSVVCPTGDIAIGTAGDPICVATSGDAAISPAGVIAFATVNANVGSFGSATNCVTFTVNGKGLITGASQTACTVSSVAITAITGAGANVITALQVAVGSAGGPVVNGGVLGTPSSGNGSNLTALNASQLSSGTIPTGRTNGHQTGTATNDNAAAGEVGEFIISEGNGTTNTVTITNATPAVITETTHGRGANSAVNFTTTGALPTGLTAGVTYYVVGSSITTNTYQVATSVANAVANTSVATSSAGSGTQSANGGAVLTTTVSKDANGLSLPAGDWDVWLTVQFIVGATTSTTFDGQWLSLSSATFTQKLSAGYASYNGGALVNYNQALTGQPARFSFAAPTTVFASVLSNFTVAGATAYATVRARRAR